MTQFDRPALQSGLFTDLYELTMAQAYHAEGMAAPAVFELFFRRLPEGRNYIVAAGLQDAVDYFEGLHFTEAEIEYLRGQEIFSEDFLASLGDLTFSGDVYAVSEGTPVFPNEPLLQVEAPILEAQLVETAVLNQIHFQSVLAGKAARVVAAAAGRNVVDFGSRRAHGTDAALKAARACYLAGGAGTSNVLAGHRYGIPIFGTMAHSYIQAHDSERQAFDAFTNLYADTTLLVDTYDTLEGVRHVIEMSRQLGESFRVRAVRLDSGDLVELAKQSRRLLDEGGLDDVQIFASSGLDEHKIAEMLSAGAPIDGFGVGTKMTVAADAPSLDMAYKLVEYDGRPRMKLSEDKVIYPGRKQVFRAVEDGCMVHDTIARDDERLAGQPLLRPVMKNGKRLPQTNVSVEDARQHCLRQHAQLPENIRRLEDTETPFPVHVSELLQQDLERLRASLREQT